MSLKSKSETKIPTVAETAYDFWVADSAGLEDTTGPIFDIANSIGLSKLLKNAKTVRVLALLHENTVRASDGRGKSLRSLVEQILGFFGPIDHDLFIDIV